MKEIWDLFDQNICPAGKTMVRGEEIPQGFMHLIVDALFLNDKGETLLQLRAKNKDILPDIWSVTGGSVLSGESSADGCKREVTEEMGFVPDMSNARLLLRQMKPEKGWFRDVYLIRQDMPLKKMHYQKEEVQSGMWILPEKIRQDEKLWRELNVLSFWKDAYPYLCLESMRIRIPEGIYRHYKGNRYQVMGLALHSETLEPMVIYRALYGTGETWVRPASMWNEFVEVNGQAVRRFAREEEQE